MAGPAAPTLPRLLAPVSRTRWCRRIGPKALPAAERVLRRLTRGRLVVSGILVPSLVLRSTGAKSGRPRSLELMDTPDGGLCAQPSMRVSRNTGMSRSVFTW